MANPMVKGGPRNVEYVSEALPLCPVSMRLTKAVLPVEPVVWYGPGGAVGNVGNRSELVTPVT
jgi:hypothetical protein